MGMIRRVSREAEQGHHCDRQGPQRWFQARGSHPRESLSEDCREMEGEQDSVLHNCQPGSEFDTLCEYDTLKLTSEMIAYT